VRILDLGASNGWVFGVQRAAVGLHVDRVYRATEATVGSREIAELPP
jgi:hypothetical protein